MYTSSFFVLATSLVSFSACQSIGHLGSLGGNGPSGGIGDKAHPVKHAQSFVTDALYPEQPNTTRQLAEGEAPKLVKKSSPVCPETRHVIVDSSPEGAQQEMVGFGHSWTDSTVSTFNSLEPDVFDRLMHDLFGQDGNNMGFMRHTIGSSDLSGVQYSYDDNGPHFNQGEPDEEHLPNFDIGVHGRAMADMIAKAGEYKSDIFLFGSPWSYPGWTKNNGLFVAPNLLNGYNLLNNSFDINYIPHMVNYFTKYVDAFKERGVTVNGVTLMNEPLNYQGGYPCMYLDPKAAAQMLKAGLGKAMRDRDVLVIAYDHNTDQQIYPARMIQGAEEHIDAVGWHCYGGQWGDYSAIPMVNQALGKNMLQFMTECSTTQHTGVNFGVAYQLLRPVHYGASGASYWVMSTDEKFGPHSPYGGCPTCQGSVIVNSSTTYTLTNDYYLIGQFSRFIRRGSINHKVLVGELGKEGTFVNEFYIIAVQNPDKGWAVVFLNNLGRDEPVRLSFTNSSTVWEGVIPAVTVTTWILPSDDYISMNATTNTATGQATTVNKPHYPARNATRPSGPTGTGRSGNSSACHPLPPLTSVPPPKGPTLLPVPNANRQIDWQQVFKV